MVQFRKADHHHLHSAEEGVALILSLFFTIIVAGVVVTGSIILKSNRDLTETSFRVNGQANQFARSGITEALAWFRRQTSQPVLDFEPIVDNLATPPIVDSDDPDVGIMREFSIAGNTWGRYEVWKEWAADPDLTRLAWRQQMELRDISTERGQSSPGGSWRLRSIGYVFRRNNPSMAFDEQPNRILASQRLEIEISRLLLAPPGQSALSVADGNSAHINTKGRIVGGATGSGIYYPTGSGTPTTGPPHDNRVTGTPSLATTTTYDDSPEAVFGVSLDDLKGMADDYVTNASNFPSPVPTNSVVVGEFSSISFDSARPLDGTALVYIKGNVSLLPGSNSNFRGLLYIDGNLTMRAPSDIQGAVVVTGNVTIQGSGDFATITYDEDVLNALRLEIGQYRLSGALRAVGAR